MNQKDLKNLKKVIKELNSPSTYEGDGKVEVMESQFNFKIERRENNLVLFDSNENYHYNYLEESNSLLYNLSLEFGFKFTPDTTDEIHDKLEKALQQDLGSQAYLEWENSVVMVIVE